MKALLIEVDFQTGKRAGNLNPVEPCLFASTAWQNIDTEPGLEIRMVNDDSDLSQFADVPGITILEGKDAINAAIQTHFPTTYHVIDRELLLAHLRERGVSLDRFAGRSLDNAAEELFKQGLAGVTEMKTELL